MKNECFVKDFRYLFACVAKTGRIMRLSVFLIALTGLQAWARGGTAPDNTAWGRTAPTDRLEQEIAMVQQSGTVTGRVTDQNGNPLPGVTIIVKGTTLGSVTDVDGNYSLGNIPGNATLVYSFVGMRTVEVAVSGRQRIDTVMQEEAIGIEEVVAIGYGVQRRSDVTGATSRLTADDLNKAIARSPIEMMQGKISGVNVIQNSGEPGAGMSVQIRGSHSIRSGQTPLYVIDGVPLDNANLTPEGATPVGVNESAVKNPMTFLNPEDIESIDVLKDASATAIYGSRGANGVVIITTKQGRKGVGEISYSGYMGISAIREKMDLLSAAEFRAWGEENNVTLPDQGASTNWQDEIFRTSFTHSHDFSFGGGSANNTYRVSLGYFDEEGIIKPTGIEKINGRMMFNQKMFDGRLDLTASIIASHIKDRRTLKGETGGYEGDVMLTTLKLNPTFPIYNEDGSYFQFSTTQRNPVAMVNLTNDITLTDRVIGNISAEFEIIKDLKYKLNIGLDRTVAERRINQDNKLTYLASGGEADINSIRASNKLIEHYFTYLKNIGEDHEFNFLLGYSYQKFKTSTTTMNVNGFTVEGILYTDNLEYGNFSTATVDSEAGQSELQSFFARVNYSFRQKYLFTLTGRLDGSTRFGENNKYGFFPSAAFAWRASEEDFVKAWNTFSNLKIRLGWGITGNQEIPNKISQISVGTENNANGFFGGNLSTGITFIRVPNPDIQWETTQQGNLGIDFGFLSNRLSGTIDLFYKRTTNVLLELTATAPAPTDRQWQNVPGLKILNKGFELGLNAAIIEKQDMTWDAGFNFSLISNNVKDLPVTLIQTGIASGQGLSDTRVQIITNDQPIGTFYGRVFQGFDENGMNIFKTDDSGAEVNEYLGSALPDFTYSLNTGLTYREFDFSMFWYGTGGNKVYNNTANALFYKPALAGGNNVTREVASSVESPTNSTGFSSRYVENGSFLRLQNVTLGYTFDTTPVPWINKARIYITGNNLLLFTNYSGFDPEVNNDANYNDVPSLGIDFTAYPRARTFTFGVNLQF